ncbi:MAG: hypothetical protein QOD07_2773 [Frankiaceae bacterium]|jgi:hypothetical protein|nr:hypothetical protein [Frankiaceae bacterium]
MPTVPNAKPFYAYVGAGEAALTRLRTRVTALPTTLKTVPAIASTLPQQAKDLREGFGTKAEKLYEELAARGEKIVTDLRGGKLGAKATSTATTTTTKPATAVKPATKPAVKKSTTAKAATPVTPVVPQPSAPAVVPTSSNGTTQDRPTS